MENPKIRIESNGLSTEVWIDGKKVEKATMADFKFHAELLEVYCEIEKYQLDENEKPIVKNGELLKELDVVIDTRRPI